MICHLVITGLFSILTDCICRQEVRVDKELGDSSASFESRLAVATAKLDQAVSDTAERSMAHTSEIVALRDQLVRDRAKADDARSTIEDRMEELKSQTGSQMEDKLVELKSRYSAELAKLQSEVGLETRELANSLKTLEAAVETHSRESRDALQGISAKVSEQARKDSTASQEKNESQDAVISDLHTSIGKLGEALGSRMHDRAGVVDARLSEISSIVNANHTSASALCDRTEAKLMDRTQTFERALESTRVALTASVQTLEGKSADTRQQISDAVNDRIHGLTTKVQVRPNPYPCGQAGR